MVFLKHIITETCKPVYTGTWIMHLIRSYPKNFKRNLTLNNSVLFSSVNILCAATYLMLNEYSSMYFPFIILNLSNQTGLKIEVQESLYSYACCFEQLFVSHIAQQMRFTCNTENCKKVLL